MKLIEETDGEDGKYLVEIPWKDYQVICYALSYVNNFWKTEIEQSLFQCTGEDVTRVDNALHELTRTKNKRDEGE